MAAHLTLVFGEAVHAIYHDRPQGVELSVPVIDLTTDWALSQGLRCVGDWGWRCGDYAHYAQRQAFPDFDHYWLIESDVRLFGDVADLFARLDGVTADALAFGIGLNPRTDARFVKGWRAFSDMPAYQGLFPMTRFSARALDHLLPARVAYGQCGVSDWRYTNDEVFSLSVLAGEGTMQLVPLEQVVPDWFDLSLFRTDPDFLEQEVVDLVGDRNQICHSVRSIESYQKSLAARMAGNVEQFARNTGPALRYMSEEDVDHLAAMATTHIRKTLMQARKRQIRRARGS